MPFDGPLAGAGLRATLRERPLIGSFIGIGHPASAEIVAWAGFELLCLDAEHSPLGAAEIESLIRAADARAVPCLVRVGSLGEASRALDSGAAGVVVPHVESAEQARACVAAVRYPPAGVRGAGLARASRYGIDLPSHFARANDEVLLAVQVETAAGVEAADEIAAVDGVDVIFVGPGDLAVSLGCEDGSSEHVAAIERILAATAAGGAIGGIFSARGEDVGRWTALGAHLLLVGSDLRMLGGAATAAAQAARDAL